MRPPERLLAYCRAGFEPECAAELLETARALGTPLRRVEPAAQGLVLLAAAGSAALGPLRARLQVADTVFARQLVWCGAPLPELDPADRVTPLLAAARTLGGPFSVAWVEHADSDAGRALGAFCRKFGHAFAAAARRQNLLDADPGLPRLHLCFVDGRHALAGVSDPAASAPWPQGIPRLRNPAGAPSRATLKLEEALLTFLGAEPGKRLQPGMTAVDLGAAPGGWSWVLARRGLRVTAVDNARLAPAVLASGMVEHVAADAFRYRPPGRVDWLVCDVVEQPARIAALVAGWVADGRCREAVFNLKLPMKRRWEALADCRARIAAGMRGAGDWGLRLRQLYHDRAEVTGHLWRGR
ncbi:MAG TPA: 23S rRNA (cytidine(2498)-2'-O)-methyltransferase RlmM [Gammaproteobacteria bacterium]